MNRYLQLIQRTEKLSADSPGGRDSKMHAMARAELGLVFGAALKLSMAMLAFEGLAWVADTSVPAIPGAAYSAKLPKHGLPVVAAGDECVPTPPEPPILIAAGPHTPQQRR